MTAFRSFEEMELWQKARALVEEVRAVCQRERARHDFSFVDQITRAARSVAANIAEGFEARSNPDFIRFLGYAKRSVGEVRSHFYDAVIEGYITEVEFKELARRTYEIRAMLIKLIRYLRENPRSPL